MNTLYLKYQIGDICLLRAFTSKDEVLRMIKGFELAMDLVDAFGIDLNGVEWKEPSRFDEWFSFEELGEIIDAIPVFDEEYKDTLGPVLDRYYAEHYEVSA